MNTQYDMTDDAQREWLDAGNVFRYNSGAECYVARKASDGAYLMYHLGYSTFGRARSLACKYGPNWTQNELWEDGDRLRALSPREQQEKLDAGEVFTTALNQGEAYVMARMSDGAYLVYGRDRQTFEALISQMARFPAWLWVAEEE